MNRAIWAMLCLLFAAGVISLSVGIAPGEDGE